MAGKAAQVSGQNPEFILRDFGGMSNLNSRESIGDDELWWCENAIPLAPGNLAPVRSSIAGAAVNEPTNPTYACDFTAAGVNYAFVVFAASGKGYIINLSSGMTWQLIITGLTSGQTFATPYNNQGLLIVDPAGYWDWNVTATGVLTLQNNAVASMTLVSAQSVAGGSLAKQLIAVTGTGATFQTQYEVTNVTLTAAGTGFAVGDTINLTDGNPTTPAQIVVASISGSGPTGPITGITLSTGGVYPGPTTTTGVATGPTGTVYSTTGAGSGATFSTHIIATSSKILTMGSGYLTGDTVRDDYFNGSIYAALDEFTVVSSGVISGTSIATYAGRVWIGYGRTVYFTDIDSYNAFGGVGGSFTISDSYLHANITVLYAANNYLYIFGDTSIDALSNVTVAAGVTSFSRINVTASVGCSSPASVFPYYRAIVFYNVSGIYLLAGATPEKISEKISGIIQNTFGGSQIYGGSVLVKGELCAVMQFIVQDVFTQGGTQRPIFALFFRGRWWLYSFPYTAGAGLLTTAFVTVPQPGGVMTLYAFRANGTTTAIYSCFTALTTLANWLIKTKLWDGGAPLHEKQSLNAAIAGTWAGAGSSGVTLNVDTENSTAVAQPITPPGAGYEWEVTLANNATQQGAQYLGLTVTGSTDMTQINLLALRGKADRNMLAG